MAVLEYPLFYLPIHHYTEKKYYERETQFIERQKHQVSFDEMSERAQNIVLPHWDWPYWKFNDIVGFLDVGMDTYDHMAADIYFRRKYFKRGTRERMHCRIPSVNNQYLYWGEVPKTMVFDLSKNEEYLSALKFIIKSAKQLIRMRNKTFKLWLPPFEFSCIDFVKAHKQAVKGNFK